MRSSCCFCVFVCTRVLNFLCWNSGFQNLGTNRALSPTLYDRDNWRRRYTTRWKTLFQKLFSEKFVKAFSLTIWRDETSLFLPEFQNFYLRTCFFEVSFLLRRSAASLGDGCPLFRDHSCLEMSGANHPTMRCQIPENRRLQLHHWGSLKTWCLTL